MARCATYFPDYQVQKSEQKDASSHSDILPNMIPLPPSPTAPSALFSAAKENDSEYLFIFSKDPFSLKGSGPSGSSSSSDYEMIEKNFNDLARYLGTSVLLSTFIAGLVITFLNLAHSIIQDKTSHEFQIAMLLCSLTAVCHLSITLVAGRACILACWFSRLPGSNRSNVEEYQEQLESFYRCLKVSEWVQGLGQALFSPAFLFTLWQMFHDHVYPIVIFSFIGVLQIAVYMAGFWRVSWWGIMTLPMKNRAMRRQVGERAV